MIPILSFCNKNLFTQDPTVCKNYLHQLLLQAQGWEFFYYSIASVYQYLHKLEWNLFKRERKTYWNSDQPHENRIYVFILTIELQQHVCFQKIFGSCNFTFSDTCTESYPKNHLEKIKSQVP